MRATHTTLSILFFGSVLSLAAAGCSSDDDSGDGSSGQDDAGTGGGT
ncbi:MAG: hypothetical protein FJ104_02755, partial [Deltaproteobacteria bacterium]|nr:hypothetical protein [Deltaproteobacteria bacterium]